MKRVKLDRIDVKILRELQQDGRMTNIELSRRVGISAPPCLRRVRALEEAGYVKGYHAVLAPDLLGYAITVYAQVSMISHSANDVAKFEQMIQQWPMVRECHELTGDYDYLLRIVAENWEAYQRFLTTQLTTAPNVSQVRSSLAMRIMKHLPGVPVEDRILAKAEG